MKITFATNEIIEIQSETLQGVNFNNYNLHRVVFEELDLNNSSFIDANLRGSFLAKANFTKANFTRANLISTDLRETNLTNAILINCKAFSALFENSNLQNANLEGASIRGASFLNAKLQGANMKCIDIENALFWGAIYDNYTLWPNTFNPEKYGCLFRK